MTTPAPTLVLIKSKTNQLENNRAFSVAAYAGIQVWEEEEEGRAGGRTPALTASSGLLLTEGPAIAWYFASISHAGLFLPNLQQQAKIVDWISFTENELVSPLLELRRVLAHEVPHVKPVFQAALDKTLAALSLLESYLIGRTFLVGNRITLADLTLGAALAEGFSFIWGKEEQQKFRNVLRFEQTIVNQSNLKHVYKDVALVEKAAVYAPAKTSKPPKKKYESGIIAKAAAVVENVKAAVAPAAANDDDASQSESETIYESNIVPPKGPLDALPKSKFNLEEWKRIYSNTDTRKEAIPWLYEHFDAEGFSIWRVDFRFNEELTQTFKSSNQIGGFFQRLEGPRKHLFATLSVLGTDDDSIISGVAILRGQDATLVLSAAPDYESYHVTRLDWEGNKDDRRFLEGALAWDLEVEGKKWTAGKAFK